MEKRVEALDDVLASLSAEQVLMVLAYARSLTDSHPPPAARGLEELLEEPA